MNSNVGAFATGLTIASLFSSNLASGVLLLVLALACFYVADRR